MWITPFLTPEEFHAIPTQLFTTTNGNDTFQTGSAAPPGLVFREDMPPSLWIQREQQRSPRDLYQGSIFFREQGNRLFSLGSFQDAVRSYGLAIQMDPHNALTYSNRSFAYYKMGDYNKAIEDARAAVRLKPSYLKAHYRLGMALLALGQSTEAEECFEKCLQLSPSPHDLNAINAALAECKEQAARMPLLAVSKQTETAKMDLNLPTIPPLDFYKLANALKEAVEGRDAWALSKKLEDDEHHILECKERGSRVKNLIALATGTDLSALMKAAEESQQALRVSLKTQDVHQYNERRKERDDVYDRLWSAARSASTAMSELHLIAEEERAFFSQYGDPQSDTPSPKTGDKAPSESIESIIERRTEISKDIVKMRNAFKTTDAAGEKFLNALEEERKIFLESKALLEEDALCGQKLQEHATYIARHTTRELSNSRLATLEPVRSLVRRVLSDAEAFHRSGEVGKELLAQEAKLESRRLVFERQRIHLQGEVEWLKVCDEADSKVHTVQRRLEEVRSRLSALNDEQATVQDKLFSLIEGDHPELAWHSMTSGSRILRLVKGSGLWVNLSLRDFEITSTLSSTANSKVYRARRRGANVVLKEISVETERAKRRLQNEVNIVVRSHHPNIVRINGVFFDGPFAYVLMPYYAKGSLKNVLDNATPLPWVKVQDMLRQLTSGLAYLHDQGIVHADIKPSNILISDEDDPIFSDFGISKDQGRFGERADVTLTSTGSISGTVNFMAPELFQSEARPTSKSDIWSLGLTFYLFVAKNSAHQNPEIGDINFPVITNNLLQINMPLTLTGNNEELANLISSMLVLDVEKRLSAHQVLSHPFFKISLLRRMEESGALIKSDEKIAAVHSFIHTYHATQRNLIVSVSRNQMVESLQSIFDSCGEDAILKPLRVVFQGEEGVDQGALTTEMLNLFFTQLVTKQKALVHCADGESTLTEELVIGDITYLPVADSQGTVSRDIFHTTGMTLVKSIVENRALPLQINASVFKYFCGVQPNMMDLEAFDRPLSQSLRRLKLLSADFTTESSLDFSDFTEEFLFSQYDGQYQRSTIINSENVDHYVHMRVIYELVEKRKKALEAMKEGFYLSDVLNNHLRLLSSSELMLLLCGSQHLSPQNIIDFLDFQGFPASSMTPEYLKQILREYSQNNLRRFLQLCTSMVAVPQRGLSRKIKVLCVGDTSHLPVGHGCVYQLDLPDYNDKNILYEKMEVTLVHVTDGFHIA